MYLLRKCIYMYLFVLLIRYLMFKQAILKKKMLANKLWWTRFQILSIFVIHLYHTGSQHLEYTRHTFWYSLMLIPSIPLLGNACWSLCLFCMLIILMLVILMLILMLLNLHTAYADTDADLCIIILSLYMCYMFMQNALCKAHILRDKEGLFSRIYVNYVTGKFGVVGKLNYFLGVTERERERERERAQTSTYQEHCNKTFINTSALSSSLNV